MYLTFEEYATWGGTLDASEFELAELEARLLIDRITFQRLKNEEEIPEAVKFCMFKLMELLAQQKGLESCPNLQDGDSISQTAIASQSNDGVSISYNVMSASELYSLNKQKIQELAKLYLQGVTNSLGQELLFRGMYPNE